MKQFRIKTEYILFTLYLLLSWIYLYYFIQPVLQYQAQQPGFSNDIYFFKGFSGFPGGITEYISVFLMQFYYFNWAGSLIIVLVALSISLLTTRLISKISPNNIYLFIVRFIPIMIILVLNNNYLYPLAATLRILLVLITLNVFENIPVNTTVKVLLFFVLAVLLYYISGGAAMIVFTLCSILLLTKSRNGANAYISGSIFILFAALFPYMAYKYIFNVSITDAYIRILPDVPTMLIYCARGYLYALYACIPVIFIISYIINGANYYVRMKNNNQVLNKSSDEFKENGTFNIKTFIPNPLKNKFLWLKERLFLTCFSFLMVCIFSCFLLVQNIDREKKYVLLSDYYAERQEWSRVIENALAYHDYSLQINWDFNRALYHTGELTDNFFKYAQLLGSDGMFPDKIVAGELAIPSCDLYFDLGFISESQRWAFEAQSLLPYSPKILKILIVNYLIQKKYTLAEKFLNVLDENFLYSNWVRQYRGLLDDTARIAENSLIAEKRKLMPADGYQLMNSKNNLLALLDYNRNNKMALEYLELYYLLNYNLKEFLYVFMRNEFYNSSRIPRVFQEALLIYCVSSKDKYKNILLQKIGADVISEFNTFNKVLKAYKGDYSNARLILQKSFSDTYWYYIMFYSPFIKKAN